MKGSIWKHKKYKARDYRGTYRRNSDGEREFVLRCEKPAHNVSFESHEAAKALGWAKQ